jgi:DNA-binding transcriptional regulator YiaG
MSKEPKDPKDASLKRIRESIARASPTELETIIAEAKYAMKTPPLEADELLERLKRLKMNQRQFARFVQVDPLTVNRWATSRTPIPHTIRLILDLMQKTK